MFVPIANMQVLFNGGESSGSVKGNNVVAFSVRQRRERDAILLGPYIPCHCHVPCAHKVFSKVESRSKLTNHLETYPVWSSERNWHWQQQTEIGLSSPWCSNQLSLVYSTAELAATKLTNPVSFSRMPCELVLQVILLTDSEFDILPSSVFYICGV